MSTIKLVSLCYLFLRLELFWLHTVCVYVSTGHPSVTMAPNCNSGSVLPVLQRPDPPTQLSLLSQSMMDQQVCHQALMSHLFLYNIEQYIVLLLG